LTRVWKSTASPSPSPRTPTESPPRKSALDEASYSTASVLLSPGPIRSGSPVALTHGQLVTTRSTVAGDVPGLETATSIRADWPGLRAPRSTGSGLISSTDRRDCGLRELERGGMSWSLELRDCEGCYQGQKRRRQDEAERESGNGGRSLVCTHRCSARPRPGRTEISSSITGADPPSQALGFFFFRRAPKGQAERAD
jgi:hypothetical protein